MGGSQVNEIESLKTKAKVVREIVVQHFIDHFEKPPLYGTFANFWASWNVQAMLEWLGEVYLTLHITILEAEFGGPIGGRPDVVATTEAPKEAEMEVGDRALVPVD